MEVNKEFDESFCTLCAVGILLAFDRLDLAAVKKIFSDAMLSVSLEDLRALPEYVEAWRRLEAAGFDPDGEIAPDPTDLNAGFEEVK